MNKYLNGPTVITEKNIKINPKNTPITVIFVIGGLTFGEISTFRFLAKQYSNILLIKYRLRNFNLYYLNHQWFQTY